MRRISVKKIRETVARLCIEANIDIRYDVLSRLKRSLRIEKQKRARYILKALIENSQEARLYGIPLCQDTGMVVVFVRLGQDVRIIGGDIKKAINDGVRDAYKNLRKSVVIDPIYRRNTQDNTPAVIYFDIVRGDKLQIVVSPRGFGSENKSRTIMLKPSSTLEDIKRFVIDTVRRAGSDACPPFVVGVGIGGTLDKAVLLSKETLLRPIDLPNPNTKIAKLEKELLEEINSLGIGPMGLGGRTTAFGVNISTYPTHIAGLPLAVNVCCHSLRSADEIL